MASEIHWSLCPYVAIDVEGTASGAGQPEGIVEVAAVEFTVANGESSTFQRLVNPGIPISRIGTRIHGLRNEDVAGHPALSALQPELAQLIDGRVVVAHNARVDWVLVHRDCPALLPVAVLDTLRLSRALWPDLRQHGLDQVLDRLGVEVTMAQGTSRRGRHTALHDATATARVFVRMVATAEERGLAVAELLDACRLADGEPGTPQLDLFAGPGS